MVKEETFSKLSKQKITLYKYSFAAHYNGSFLFVEQRDDDMGLVHYYVCFDFDIDDTSRVE